MPTVPICWPRATSWPGPDQERVQMSVERVDGFDGVAFGGLAEAVADHDDVPPAHVHVPRQDDDPVAGAVDRIAQVGIAAAVAVPVVAQVPVGGKAARLVVAVGVGPAHGEVEAIRHPRVGRRSAEPVILRGERPGKQHRQGKEAAARPE